MVGCYCGRVHRVKPCIFAAVATLQFEEPGSRTSWWSPQRQSVLFTDCFPCFALIASLKTVGMDDPTHCSIQSICRDCSLSKPYMPALEFFGHIHSALSALFSQCTRQGNCQLCTLSSYRWAVIILQVPIPGESSRCLGKLSNRLNEACHEATKETHGRRVRMLIRSALTERVFQATGLIVTRILYPCAQYILTETWCLSKSRKCQNVARSSSSLQGDEVILELVLEVVPREAESDLPLREGIHFHRHFHGAGHIAVHVSRSSVPRVRAS